MTLLARFLEWWRGPYVLHWGTYPQRPGRKHTHRVDGYADYDTASVAAYRFGAHWYRISDRRGREVWSSDHDIDALRRVDP